jgi:hypothetical protein
MTRALYDRVGGYDERYAGVYGTDGAFKRGVEKNASAVIEIKEALIRVPREVIADASTTTLARKSPDNDRSQGREGGANQGLGPAAAGARPLRLGSGRLMLSVVTWRWKPRRGYRSSFGPETVNVLRSMVRRWYPKPHRFICVTDDPAGIEPGSRSCRCGRSSPTWPTPTPPAGRAATGACGCSAPRPARCSAPASSRWTWTASSPGTWPRSGTGRKPSSPGGTPTLGPTTTAR